jgi:cell division protein FtsB
MRQTLNIKDRLKNMMGPFVGVLIFFYFCVFIFQSVQAQEKIERSLVGLQTDLKTVSLQKSKIEHQVSLLKSQNLDSDYLDERSRETLGLAHPDEVILYGVF